MFTGPCECAPGLYGAKLTHGPPTDAGFFYDSFMGSNSVTPEMKAGLEKKAKQIADSKQDYERIVVTKEECVEALAKEHEPSRMRRARALTLLAGHNMLDFHNMAVASRLRGTPFELDTVQLWQQPQGGGSIKWATEVWDVRQFSRRNAFVYPRAGTLDGTPCKPAPNYVRCRACNGSMTARNCREPTKAESDLKCDD